EGGVDPAVVGDVVAAVGHRGGVPGGEPERVDAEVPQVGQARADAREVAHAVAVGVGERADVHLVDDRVAPPGGVVERGGRHGGPVGAAPADGGGGCGTADAKSSDGINART